MARTSLSLLCKQLGKIEVGMLSEPETHQDLFHKRRDLLHMISPTIRVIVGALGFQLIVFVAVFALSYLSGCV